MYGRMNEYGSGKSEAIHQKDYRAKQHEGQGVQGPGRGEGEGYRRQAQDGCEVQICPASP